MRDPLELVRRVEATGVRLSVTAEGKLRASPSSKLSAELRSELRAGKEGVLRALCSPPPLPPLEAPASALWPEEQSPGTPLEVRRAREARELYRATVLLAAFIAAQARPVPGGSVSLERFASTFDLWCRWLYGVEPPDAPTLERSLQRRGYRVSKSKGSKLLRGLELLRGADA